MKSSFVLALLSSGWLGGVPVAHAYVSRLPSSSSSTSTSSPSSFVGLGALRRSSSTHHSRAALRMDLEDPDATFATARLNLDRLLREQSQPRPTLDQAQAQYGMPWKSSIDPKSHRNEDLLYMPFWEWQTSFMQDNLTNLQVVSCGTDYGYQENTAKKARIVSLCLSSNEYRKIRLTYYDAGDNTQVFNAVFYPDPTYNLPVLGIDVLAFNRKKYLAIVDFQPLHDAEADHATTYEHLLQPIKEQYENLKGRMSSKFYDETKFFSQQMLFSRFEDESIIQRELFPAFQQYVQTHLQLIRDTPPDYSNIEAVMERQQAYDTYSAERDPATGLFTAMFGAEWAEGFVHDFLFSLSERPAAKSQTAAASGAAAPAAGPPSSRVPSTPIPSQAVPLQPSQLAFVQQRHR